MKLHLTKQALSEGLDRVSAIVQPKHSKEVLKYVCLRVHDTELAELCTSDGLSYLRTQIECESEGQPCKILLDPQRIGAIVRNCRNDRLTIELGPSELIVHADGNEFAFPVRDPSEFPWIPDSGTDVVVIAAADLVAGFQRTAFACDTESTRYQLGGVLLTLGYGEAVQCVATDGRRLAVYSSENVEQSSEVQSSIVPQKSALLAARLFSGKDVLAVSQSGNTIRFRDGQTTLVSPICEGRYPNWQTIIPKDQPQSYKLNAGQFLHAVRQASITASEETKGLLFSFGGNCLKIANETKDIGKSNVSVVLDECGEDLAITCDWTFLAEWIKGLDQEQQVEIRLKDPSKPILVQCDRSMLVVMPMAKV